MARPKHAFTPSPEQMALWPQLSGNRINGQDDPEASRPRPIYWHEPSRTPHGPLQRWFYARSANDPLLAEARARRQETLDRPSVRWPTRRNRSRPRPASSWSRLRRCAKAGTSSDRRGATGGIFEGYEVRSAGSQ